MIRNPGKSVLLIVLESQFKNWSFFFCWEGEVFLMIYAHVKFSILIILFSLLTFHKSLLPVSKKYRIVEHISKKLFGVLTD